jgi:hypothetical protein
VKPWRFQSGGTLREGSIYVERRADRELPEALCRGELCYVLAPRQMGKSSLRARAEAALEARGVRAAGIDITALGSTGVTPDQWYFGLVDELSRRLGLGDPVGFWESQRRLSPVRRWSRYLLDEVLHRIPSRVVVFLDEIDAVRALPFSADDFFASLRALYNARLEYAPCRRLSFCMMGVAAPGELVQDLNRTPFNVGQGIRIEDFTREEAEAFLPGLRDLAAEPSQLLDPILEWTEGHPYMTQRVCEALVRGGYESDLPARVHVARLVGELFLTRGRVEDLNLSAVERFFSKDRAGPYASQMLALYQRLLDDKHVLAVSDDPVQTALRLAGMAAERDDGATVWLRVRNPIFASVFDGAWASERMAQASAAGPQRRRGAARTGGKVTRRSR